MTRPGPRSAEKDVVRAAMPYCRIVDEADARHTLTRGGVEYTDAKFKPLHRACARLYLARLAARKPRKRRSR